MKQATEETAAGRGASALRVGIDASCLASGRGYGRFLCELLPALQRQAAGRELLLFVDEPTARQVALPELPVVRVPTRRSQAEGASARGHRSVRDALRLGRAVATAHLDVFYFPSVFSYFPVPGRVPIAVAIHDTIPERHSQIVFPTRKTRWLWKAKSRLARWQARSIITVSEYARRNLVAELHVPEERIFVTPEAPSDSFRPPPERGFAETWLAARGIPRAPFLLYVGGMNPHKNVLGLVRSFAQLGEASGHPAAQLVLVGDFAGDRFHDNAAEIRREARRMGVAPRVHWTGFVPDAELRHLYGAATALVLPSLEEGFGLPAVEAAACGTPCVATRESPLPEVLEGGGLFFDPRDGDALLVAMETMLRKPMQRARLASCALLRARKLSWEISARETWRALEATARGSA